MVSVWSGSFLLEASHFFPICCLGLIRAESGRDVRSRQLLGIPEVHARTQPALTHDGVRKCREQRTSGCGGRRSCTSSSSGRRQISSDSRGMRGGTLLCHALARLVLPADNQLCKIGPGRPASCCAKKSLTAARALGEDFRDLMSRSYAIRSPSQVHSHDGCRRGLLYPQGHWLVCASSPSSQLAQMWRAWVFAQKRDAAYHALPLCMCTAPCEGVAQHTRDGHIE